MNFVQFIRKSNHNIRIRAIHNHKCTRDRIIMVLSMGHTIIRDEREIWTTEEIAHREIYR